MSRGAEEGVSQQHEESLGGVEVLYYSQNFPRRGKVWGVGWWGRGRRVKSMWRVRLEVISE